MSDLNKIFVDALLDPFRQVVPEEIAKALDKRPARLNFTTKEAAEMLNVPESWLAQKARDGLIPCRMMGHYRLFSMADIEEILEACHIPGDITENSQAGLIRKLLVIRSKHLKTEVPKMAVKKKRGERVSRPDREKGRQG